jgi:transposase
MEPARRARLREELLEEARRDPEKVVDLLLDLLERVEKLEDQLKKNSSNSSKPPSLDKGSSSKLKNRSLRGKSGKKSGGQKGRRGATLERVDTPDETIRHSLDVCPVTGRKLSDRDVVGEIRCQVFDIPEPKMRVTEHVYLVYSIPGSSKTVHYPFVDGASAPVQYGSRFGALLVYLSDFQLIPMARLAKLCFDLYGREISAATIERFRKPCFEHLEKFEEQLKKDLLKSPVLHADETGIRILGKTQWLHVISNAELTYLWASDHRGRAAIDEMQVLNSYTGTLIHDCLASYFALDCNHGLCNAHLMRELNFFSKVKEHRWAARMQKLLINALNNPAATSGLGWRQRYARILAEANAEHPYAPPAREKKKRGCAAKPAVNNLIARFEKYKEEILRFVFDPKVPFTNNQAERDLRMAKVQQKISGTFRTWKGAIRFARIRSYISTAQKQGGSVYQAIHQALNGCPMFC